MRQERREDLAVPVPCCSALEREAEEGERRRDEIAAASVFSAVHDPGLGRVQLQPDLLHPVADRPQDFAGSTLGTAVDNRVIGVAFELDVPKIAGEPLVERLVQEQIRQNRRDRSPLRGAPVSLPQGAVG